MTQSHTLLTKTLDLAVPVISAPMTSVADLAAAAAKAGALGLIGTGILSPHQLKQDVQSAQQQLQGQDEQHSAIGVDLLTFLCSQVKITVANHSLTECWGVYTSQVFLLSICRVPRSVSQVLGRNQLFDIKLLMITQGEM
jgi:NAD(P)H-dependent flavin oxidoreductase YrpB (nitropropane dioxygenase family)